MRYLLALALLAGCGNEREEAPTAGSSSAAITPPGAPAAGTRVKWPKASCTILQPEAVGAVIGKQVRARDQYAVCDYLSDNSAGVSVHFYDASEFAIFKGRQAARGGKDKAVPGLGVEAIDGNSGTGAGLAVLLDDGRSFMVEGGNADQRQAIAKLVLAVR